MVSYDIFTMDGKREKTFAITNREIFAHNKREYIANVLGLNYEGVLKYKNPRSKYDNPTIQEKIVISSSNGTYLAMSKKSFETKKEVNMSFKKNNSYGENLIAEYFINTYVDFIRECSIMGYHLSPKYEEVKNLLSQEAKDLLEELERAIADFIVFPCKKDEPTIILAINGSLHHKKYDELWTKFEELGLAKMLNFKYVVIDTCCDYQNIKNNEMSQIRLIDYIDSITGKFYHGNYKEIKKELKSMKKNLVSKEIASLLRDYSEVSSDEILNAARSYYNYISYEDFNESEYSREL